MLCTILCCLLRKITLESLGLDITAVHSFALVKSITVYD